MLLKYLVVRSFDLTSEFLEDLTIMENLISWYLPVWKLKNHAILKKYTLRKKINSSA
jgi:hypothetical protein